MAIIDVISKWEKSCEGGKELSSFKYVYITEKYVIKDKEFRKSEIIKDLSVL